MTFKFSLVSDLHVDHPQPSIPKESLEHFIVVAGDTANGLLGTKMLNKWKRRGHDVFAIDGNHEHYGNRSQGRWSVETEQQFYALLDQTQCRVVAPGVHMLGINGWYPVSDQDSWRNYMNDSRWCNLDAKTVTAIAENSAKWVDKALSKLPDGHGAIVVTHTAPTETTLNPEFDGHYSNEWYWNPFMEQVMVSNRKKILVWCHGHTHAPADKIVHGVRVVCNPRGYPRENPSWAPLTIQV